MALPSRNRLTGGVSDSATSIAERLSPNREPFGASEQSETGGLVWQLVDSAFPTGGFAHSGGLEAAWQHGEIRGAGDLASFAEASLNQAGRASLPFAIAAHREPERLIELDDLCETFTTNHVANRASRLQGRAFRSSIERIFGPTIDAVSQITVSPHGHFAPVFGAMTRALAVNESSSARLFLFWHLRGLMGSAVRLGILGPMEAQTVQYKLAESLQQVLIAASPFSLYDVAQTAPLLEIWQAAQDRLYSRLFQS